MKKLYTIVAIISVMLISSTYFANVTAAPSIQRPNEIIFASIGGPWTIDPAACYDTSSGTLLMNMYDTLIFFEGEHLDIIIPALATSWVVENITGTTDPDTGLNFYYRYVFEMRTGVKYHDGSTMIPADVEYSIERAMVMDFAGGPQWMFYEPLLNGAAATFVNNAEYDMTIPADVIKVGKMIDHSCGSNATHAWFNIGFPSSYPPFLQILGQPWASIYSKAWSIGLGRENNWDGNWGDYSTWVQCWNPEVALFDTPTPVANGQGPYVYESLDYTLKQWSINRYEGYWRGWPAPFPKLAGAQPKGYIDHFVTTWAYEWATRSTMFLNGDVDYCDVPRINLPEMFTDAALKNPKAGIRCITPLPNLAVDALFYAFNISKASPYGTINDPGVFTEGGLPSDFFGNPTWGVNVRKAFSHMIDFNAYIQGNYLGEASVPATCIIPGLPYYDASVKGYTFDTAAATTLLKTVPGLWDTGFTIPLAYNDGNLGRQGLCNSLKAALEALNPKFHATITTLAWNVYGSQYRAHYLPAFTIGWQVDYPDPHDFVSPFYYSYGTYAKYQNYVSTAMDALIMEGIMTPEGPARQAVYTAIEKLVIEECPSVAIAQVIGRHFERDWITGWYYNIGYSGPYVYTTWKWYYVPSALFSSVSDTGYTSNIPVDANYDGVVNILDIAAVAGSFGTSYGPPIPARWVFRGDIDNNRIINILDIASVARYFTKTSPVWTHAT